MARPQKKEGEKLNRQLPPARCTQAEYILIQSKAAQAGIGISEYLRRTALSGKVVVQQSQTDFELLFQLKKIGVNLNQQTRVLHETGRVTDQLWQIWLKLDALLDTLRDDAPHRR